MRHKALSYAEAWLDRLACSIPADRHILLLSGLPHPPSVSLVSLVGLPGRSQHTGLNILDLSIQDTAYRTQHTGYIGT